MTFTGDLYVEGGEKPEQGQGEVTIAKAENSQFQVAFSLLGSASTTVKASSKSLDVVLMIDLSPMSNSQDGKVKNMLTAVNGAIAQVIDSNPDNRVSVVAYSSQAKVLLPLGHYKTVDLEYTGAATQQSKVKCTYIANNSEHGNEDTNSSSREFIVAPNGGGMNKYTQYGIYAGMKALMGEVDEHGNIIENSESNATTTDNQTDRQPVMILLSEGDPKIASTDIITPTQSSVPEEGLGSDFDKNYAYTSEPGSTSAGGSNGQGVEIIRNYNIADDSAGNGLSAWNNRHAQAFATLLTAAYAKEKISKYYYGEDSTNNKAKFYTVGIRTNSANSPELAEIVLNPSVYLNPNDAEAVCNDLRDDFIGYANAYFGSPGTVSLIDAGKNTESDGNAGTAHKTTFTYNGSGLEGYVTSLSDLYYNDMFFNATEANGGQVNYGNIFDEIFSNIATEDSAGTTYVPMGEDDGESGYVIYTDPIGKYMEIKDVDALIHSNIVYKKPVVGKDDEGNTTYTFSGMASNPVYGAHNVSLIRITVKTDEEGNQTLEVKVPAALIPLRDNHVRLETSGNETSVAEYTMSRMYPMRLVYSVGLKTGEDADIQLQDGKITADSTIAKDSDYLYKYYDEDTKTITFNAGVFSKQDEQDPANSSKPDTERTIGDTTVTYMSSAKNPFYYLQEQTPVYKDADCIDRLKESDSEQDTYWFKVPYYVHNADGTLSIAYDTISRPAALLKEKYTAYEENSGNAYLKVGTPRMSSLNDYIAEKEEDKTENIQANQSNTAEIRMFPTFIKEDEAGSSQPGNGKFTVYLGNNGKLTVPVAENFEPEQPSTDDPDTPGHNPGTPGGTTPEQPGDILII